jgi:hypothetical protein
MEKFGFGIRDKHPGSATLPFTIVHNSVCEQAIKVKDGLEGKFFRTNILNER